eukprot:5174102-Ditylum_brightwellii.AAC.1
MSAQLAESWSTSFSLFVTVIFSTFSDAIADDKAEGKSLGSCLEAMYQHPQCSSGLLPVLALFQDI